MSGERYRQCLDPDDCDILVDLIRSEIRKNHSFIVQFREHSLMEKECEARMDLIHCILAPIAYKLQSARNGVADGVDLDLDS